MKTFSLPQIIFSLLGFVSSLIFFQILCQKLEDQEFQSIPLLACIYMIAMFFSGLFCGIFDPLRARRIDLGFRYHLITFMIVHAALVCILLVRTPEIDQFQTISSMQFLAWGLGLLIHFRISKGTIKGYSPDELF